MIELPASWLSASEEETRAIGARLAPALAPDGVVLLFGELGTGKTVLVRGLAAALGVDPAEVCSPSFTLLREHSVAGPGVAAGETSEPRLIHVDLYRLTPEEAGLLGLEEALAGPGVKAVEWAERLPFAVPGAVRVEIERGGSGRRRIRALRAAAEGGAAQPPPETPEFDLEEEMSR